MDTSSDKPSTLTTVRLRPTARGDLVSAALLGTVVALGVALPWLGSKPLFLLDWTVGPRTPTLPRQAFGLDGGLTAGLPGAVLAGLLQHLLGGAATWLPIVIVFPIAAVGLARLGSWLGCSRLGQLGGALLYVANPFVLDRIAVGHIGLLLGYAFLPHLVLVVLRDGGGSFRSASLAGLLLAVMMGLSIHLLWIAAPVLGLALPFLYRTKRGLLWTAVVGAAAAACSAYLLIGPLVATRAHALPGKEDLVAYQSRGASLGQLAGHLVSLQGFWRPVPQEPIALLPGWPLITAGLIVVAGAGLVSSARGVGRQAAASRLLGLAGLSALVLAFGSRGPSGPAFRLFYDHLPLFRVMREPQKFDALWALVLACGFALGIDRLLAGHTGRRRILGAAVLASLALAFSPSIFWGLGGSVKPSTVPASYAAADHVMGDPDNGVLVLPWHLYLAFPYTQGRVIYNPAPMLFHREVLAGDLAELPGVPEQQSNQRSAAVSSLISLGATSDVSARLRSLQVRYVLLVRGGDWPSYGWLAHQTGLRSVMDTPELELYALTTPLDRCDLRHTSLVEYRARCRGLGLVLPEPYDPGWRVKGQQGQPNAVGLTGFTVRRGPVTARYAPAWRARALLALSSVSAALLLMTFAWDKWLWQSGRGLDSKSARSRAE